MEEIWVSIPQASETLGWSIETIYERIEGGVLNSRLAPDGTREISIPAMIAEPTALPMMQIPPVLEPQATIETFWQRHASLVGWCAASLVTAVILIGGGVTVGRMLTSEQVASAEANGSSPEFWTDEQVKTSISRLERQSQLGRDATPADRILSDIAKNRAAYLRTKVSAKNNK